MGSIHIALNYQVVQAQHRDLVAHAERQRLAAMALPTRPWARSFGIAEVRAAIAASLLRAGSWLMPDRAPEACV